MSLFIDSLSALCGAIQRGIPAEEAIAAYYAQRSMPQLEAEYTECARTLARWEEAGRADQVKMQRNRLVAIDTELKKRRAAA